MDVEPHAVADAGEEWRAALDRAIGPTPPVGGAEDVVAAGRLRLRRRRRVLGGTTLVAAAAVAALVGAVVETGTRSAEVAVAREDVAAGASSGAAGVPAPTPSTRTTEQSPSAFPDPWLGVRDGSLGPLLTRATKPGRLLWAGTEGASGHAEHSGSDPLEKALRAMYDLDTHEVTVPDGYRETGRISDPVGDGSVAWSMQSIKHPSRYTYVLLAFIPNTAGAASAAEAYVPGIVVGRDAFRPKLDLRTWAAREAPEIAKLRAEAPAHLAKGDGLGHAE